MLIKGVARSPSRSRPSDLLLKQQRNCRDAFGEPQTVIALHEVGHFHPVLRMRYDSWMWTVRRYELRDAPLLLDLFRDTIRRVNSKDYSPAQIAAWASDEIDPEAWANRFTGRLVLVAVSAIPESKLPDSKPTPRFRLGGFCDLEPSGHLDRFYVSADCQGLGIGRLLFEHLQAEIRDWPIDRIWTEASITARPFFERIGFELIRPQTVLCRGVEFLNYQMQWHRRG